MFWPWKWTRYWKKKSSLTSCNTTVFCTNIAKKGIVFDSWNEWILGTMISNLQVNPIPYPNSPVICTHTSGHITKSTTMTPEWLQKIVLLTVWPRTRLFVVPLNFGKNGIMTIGGAYWVTRVCILWTCTEIHFVVQRSTSSPELTQVCYIILL